MCSKFVIAGSVAAVGVVLVALGGGLGWGLFPYIITDQITKNLALSKDSAAYEAWQKIPQPLNFKVYIMEVANPQEVHEGRAKPTMKETGPFIYLETKEKENIVFSEDGSTVDYQQRTFFEFSPELSAGLTEDDEVTVLNAALMGMIVTPDAADNAILINTLAQGYKYLFDDPESVFTTVRVGDLLFDGIEILCGNRNGTIVWDLVCEGLKSQASPSIRCDNETGNCYYSFFNHKANKTDGLFKVLTGKTDIMKLGEIVEWENAKSLSYWSGPECNMIRGGDATIFPPFNTKDTRIKIFTTDLCRSIYLSFDKEIEHEGIRGYRYIVDPIQLGNVTAAPDNYCYCPPNGACLYDGAMDLSPCFDAPVILTLPHFYQAPHYLDTVDGLTPSKEEHEIFIDMEVHTGAPFGAGRRVQFNMMIKPIRGFEITKNLPEAIVPLIWVNEALTLNEENTNKLKDEFISKLQIVDGVRWGLIGVGSAAFVAGAALFFVWHGSSKKPENK